MSSYDLVKNLQVELPKIAQLRVLIMFEDCIHCVKGLCLM